MAAGEGSCCRSASRSIRWGSASSSQNASTCSWPIEASLSCQSWKVWFAAASLVPWCPPTHEGSAGEPISGIGAQPRRCARKAESALGFPMKMHSAKVSESWIRAIGFQSRRQFLAGAMAGAASLWAWPTGRFTRTPARPAAVGWPCWRTPASRREVGVHTRALVEMLEEGLCIALNKPTAAAAWQGILRKDDKILLKCNRADADRLCHQRDDGRGADRIADAAPVSIRGRSPCWRPLVRTDWAGELATAGVRLDAEDLRLRQRPGATASRRPRRPPRSSTCRS